MSTLATPLGLYRALADGGPQTVRELAERTGADERQVREWLSEQSARDRVAYDRQAGIYAITEPEPGGGA
jgi:hypothetical protein